MYKHALALGVLLAPALAVPQPAYVEERHIIEVEKRQGGANFDQLLQLASLAGITALPTDPLVLLSLGPLANSLASALPTSSVLSVLLTAAPSDFVSNIVNDQSYAQSFESDFQAGNSPSWFQSLPTDVRSYLHTYSGFGGIAGAAGAIEGAATGASALSSGAASESESRDDEDGSTSMTMTMTSGSGSSASMTGSASDASETKSETTSAAGQGEQSESDPTSASSEGGAGRPTGVIAAGVVGLMGVLGVAAAL